MAGLLVSVRSAAEATAAVAGGATVVDIKEPLRGPLGRADASVWRSVRAAVPPSVAVSVALGELLDLDRAAIRPEDCAGISFRKAGPAGSRTDWRDRWETLLREGPPGVGLVAVAYLDWREADAPDPSIIFAAARASSGCPGVLLDTWNKSQRIAPESALIWRDQIEQTRAAGRFVALAGGLDLAAIVRLRTVLTLDLFAVRGAACGGGDRHGVVNAAQVTPLAIAAAGGSLGLPSNTTS